MDMFMYRPHANITSTTLNTAVQHGLLRGAGFNTFTDYYTKPNIWHLFLGNTSSVLQLYLYLY